MTGTSIQHKYSSFCEVPSIEANQPRVRVSRPASTWLLYSWEVLQKQKRRQKHWSNRSSTCEDHSAATSSLQSLPQFVSIWVNHFLTLPNDVYIMDDHSFFLLPMSGSKGKEKKNLTF